MPLEISRIQAICFDVDGTLRDTDDQMVDQIARRLRLVRFLFSKNDPKPFARWLVMGMETPANFVYGIPDWLGIDDDLAQIDARIRKIFPSRHQYACTIIPRVKETLLALKPHYPLAVVSARDEKTTLAFLEEFTLKELFQHIATALTCEHTKPYPDPVLWAADQMKASPENCLMVGDTTVDIRAGKEAGAQTVGVLSGFGTEGELRRAGADLILPSVEFLPGILFNVNSVINQNS